MERSSLSASEPLGAQEVYVADFGPLVPEVTVSAPVNPANHPGWILDSWFINWVPVPDGVTTVTFPVDMECHSMLLIYRELPPADIKRLRQGEIGTKVGSPDQAE